MELWGAKVIAGEPLKVKPDEGYRIHISHASLESKARKVEHVLLFVNVDGKKTVIGSLAQRNISFGLVFEKEFELSYNSEKGTVHFIGYKSPNFSGPEETGDEEVPSNGNPGAIISNVVEAETKVEVKPESEDDFVDDDEYDDEYDDDYEGDEDFVERLEPISGGNKVPSNGNSGSIVSNVVKAETKADVKPEEVKPQSEDDFDDDFDDDDDAFDDDFDDDDEGIKGGGKKGGGGGQPSFRDQYYAGDEFHLGKPMDSDSDSY